MLNKADYNLKGEELEMARDLMKMSDGWNLDAMRSEDAKPGALFGNTSQRAVEVAKRAGQAVLQYQKYLSERRDLIDEYRKSYARTTFGGFVQPVVNAPVNIANGVSEPVRAAEKVAFGTDYIPEIPRLDIAKDSPYWQKDGRLLINGGAEIVSTVVIGGILGARAMATQTGRILMGIEAGYNVGAGTVGIDAAKPEENGEFRRMSFAESAARVAGGILGARQIVNAEIKMPN